MTFIDPATIHDPSVGATIPSSWGDQINDDVNFVARDAPYARVYRTTDFAVAPSTYTAIPFDTEDDDNYGMHNTGSARIVLPVAGVYAFGGAIEYVNNASGTYRHILQVWRNGSAIGVKQEHTTPPDTVTTRGLMLASERRFSAGQYIELVYWTDQPDNGFGVGGIVSATTESPNFWAEWRRA